MKIGFLCESPADQAAMAVFAMGLLGQEPEPIKMSLAAHGVSGVFNVLNGVYRGLHYGYEADGLVVVVDCDEAELHEPAHDLSENAGEKCRLCQLRKVIKKAQNHVKPLAARKELKVAIGLAVPAIEAWYLVGKEKQVGEAIWKVGLNSNRPPFTKQSLKKMVYGTDRPSLELETARAVSEAERIIKKIEDLEIAFPAGFGSMAKEIRSWVNPQRAVVASPT
jgi:hypothetical protein